MKKLFCYLFLLQLIPAVYSQDTGAPLISEKSAFTVGILQGGGSIVGADVEFMLSDRPGIQLGFGFVGFGAGVNYHLKPTIRSSFISLQYWHQGIGDKFAQDVLGPTFVFRGKKWLTFQIGMGAPLSRGPALADNYTQPPVMLLYSVGAYFPF
jgi:hypothetical protein